MPLASPPVRSAIHPLPETAATARLPETATAAHPPETRAVPHALATQKLAWFDRAEIVLDKFFGIKKILLLGFLGTLAGFVAGRSADGGTANKAATRVGAAASVPQTAFNEIPSALGMISNRAERATGRVGPYAQKALGHGVSDRLGNLSPLDTVSIVFSVFSLFRIVKDYVDRRSALKHLYQDVRKGDEPVGMPNKDALPTMVKDARSRSMGIRVGGAAILQGLLTGGSIAMMVGKSRPAFMQRGPLSNPFAQMFFLGGLNMIPSWIMGKNPADVYRASHVAHGQGEMLAQDQLGEDMYYHLTGTLSPKGMSDAKVHELADSFRKAGMDPKQIAIAMRKVGDDYKVTQGAQAQAETKNVSAQPEGKKLAFLHSKFAMGAVFTTAAVAVGSFAAMHSKRGGAQAGNQGGIQGVFQKLQDSVRHSAR